MTPTEEQLKETEKQKAQENKIQDTQSQREKPFPCYLCNKSYTTKRALGWHAETHDPSIKEKVRFPCQICNKNYSTKGSLSKHTRRHKSIEHFHCDHCDIKYVFRSSLRKHNRQKHREHPLLYCRFCNYEAPNENDRFFHIMNSHTGCRKCNVCDSCGYKTNNKWTLEAHIRRKHVGKKIHCCNMCDYKSTDKGGLTSHYARIHIKEKPFLCHICDYRCSYKNTLNRHLRKHLGKNEKNYKHHCSFCGHKFLTKTRLDIHLRVHTGEKPYACDVCDRRFSQKSTLATHNKLVHLKEKRKKQSGK